MKSFFIFIAGMITMFVGMVLFGMYNEYFLGEGNVPGLTYLSEQQVGKTFEYRSIKIIQAHSQNTALVLPNQLLASEPVMFLLGKESDAFYDDQIINIPKGYKLVQVGTYRYTTREKFEKIVPAVAIVK
ncbi:MAG: hypothetical protein IKN62_01720 [Elusimicrobia bacterium]|nr:hypothetical protein [Elusimicrobiota bacterium]